MTLSAAAKLELMRQGIIHRYIIPTLEIRGFIVSRWKRPVSFEDMILRDEGWIPQYTPFTTWETYVRDAPLFLYFNSFYGDVYERAYKHCFVEYLINVKNYSLSPELTGIFTRLNVEGGYYWKNRVPVDLSAPDKAVNDIDNRYDELVLALSQTGTLSDLEERNRHVEAGT